MNQMKTAPHVLVSARKKYIANRECLNQQRSNYWLYKLSKDIRHESLGKTYCMPSFIVQSYHYLSIFSIQLGKKLTNTLKVNSGIKERKTAITIFSYEIVIYYSKHK